MNIAPLGDDEFFQVLKSAPLISIDLIIHNKAGKVLLGRRTNRPAKGVWFTPGGRVRKGEKIAQAFKRITRTELGAEAEIKDARYLGLYEHFYEDSFYSDELSTHYVVNAFELILSGELALPNDQHTDFQWFSTGEVLNTPDVHMHTRWYFQEDQGFKTHKNKGD